MTIVPFRSVCVTCRNASFQLGPGILHADLKCALSHCSWLSPAAFARADYANQDWFPCIARRHRSFECWIRAVLLRCWKGIHCLSAAWHFRSVHGRLHVNNPFASLAVTCTMSQLRTSSERKLSFSATRQPFTVEIALLYVFSLSNSLFYLSFLRLSDLSHTQEQARSMPSMQAVAPSPSHNRDGSEKVRTFDKRTHRHKPLDLQDAWASCGYDTLNCAILSKYELLRASARRQFASARRQIGTGLFFRSNFCWFRSNFAWALPLSLSSPWTMNFFSETTNTDKKRKLVPNARLPR